MDLCSVCVTIPFSSLFGSSRKPKEHLIGSLAHAQGNRSDCSFCSFLVQAFELAYGLKPEQSIEKSKNSLLKLQIEARANTGGRDVEEPWFEKLGLTADVKTGPALWLHTVGTKKRGHELGEHLVCISCMPTTKQKVDSY